MSSVSVRKRKCLTLPGDKTPVIGVRDGDGLNDGTFDPAAAKNNGLPRFRLGRGDNEGELDGGNRSSASRGESEGEPDRGGVAKSTCHGCDLDGTKANAVAPPPRAFARGDAAESVEELWSAVAWAVEVSGRATVGL